MAEVEHLWNSEPEIGLEQGGVMERDGDAALFGFEGRNRKNSALQEVQQGSQVFLGRNSEA